jgi:hypothetical protein
MGIASSFVRSLARPQGVVNFACQFLKRTSANHGVNRVAHTDAAINHCHDAQSDCLALRYFGRLLVRHGVKLRKRLRIVNRKRKLFSGWLLILHLPLFQPRDMHQGGQCCYLHRGI